MNARQRFRSPGGFLLFIILLLVLPAAEAAAQTLDSTTVTLPEGNSGYTDFEFVITLNPPAGLPVSVDWTVANGTATAADNDYVPASGTAYFDPGETTATVTVQVVGDTKYEGQEYFYFQLSNPVNASIQSPGYVPGYISNDDVRITSSNVTHAEGNTGLTDYVFTLTLSDEYPLPVSVDWTVANGTATAADNDYVPASGTAHFDPGETIATVTVQVVGDTKYENQEYFYLQLSNVWNASLPSPPYVVGYINNDDVQVSGSNITHYEGNTGLTDFVFTLTLSGTYPLPVSVNWALRNGTATVADNDYVPASGTAYFDPGETATTVTVQVVGDTKYENQEYFYLDLLVVVNASPGKQYLVGYINNDDVRISSSAVTLPEGNTGLTDFVFTLTLSAPYTLPVSVDWEATDSTATVADNDYVPASGTAHFDPGETATTVTVQVVGDTKYELSEYFYLEFSNPVNASLASPGYVVGNISNDDVRVASSVVTLPEGNTGLTDFVFTVTLSAPYTLPVSVDWETTDGTATAADNDYVPASGTAYFAPGETATTVTVQVVGDTKYEIQEYFYLEFSNPVNASLASPGYVTGNISNDDVRISTSNMTLPEGDTGLTDFVFTLALSGPYPLPVSVDWNVTDGTATVADNDYVPASGTAHFDPGETTTTVTVQGVGDYWIENDEYFVLNLSNAVNASINTATASGYLENDDTLPVASVDDVALAEGHSGTFDFIFTVSLDPPPLGSVSVSYSTSPVSATPWFDYLPASGTLNFSASQETLPIAVTVVGETDHEIDETFRVTLSSPGGLVLGDAEGEGVILDDDPACPGRPGPVTDLALTVAGGGTQLQFNWTDVDGADEYVLHEHESPVEPFAGPAGSSASGATGILLPMPEGSRYYLLSSASEACGPGPRHLCAHDPCVAGDRLDSGCDLCAAAVCTISPECCETAWDAACVAAVPGACGLTCTP